jgi:hypothetical protein
VCVVHISYVEQTNLNFSINFSNNSSMQNSTNIFIKKHKWSNDYIYKKWHGKKTKDKREKQNKTKVEINVGDTSEFRL